jgi:hypothetical protein
VVVIPKINATDRNAPLETFDLRVVLLIEILLGAIIKLPDG